VLGGDGDAEIENSPLLTLPDSATLPRDMRVLVLTNPHSGPQGSNEQRARDAFAQCAGVEAVVRAMPGNQVTDAAHRAVGEGFDCIVAAGGDGTVNAVASALVGTTVALGVLPLGTLNHFAKDLGLPLEITAAARAISAGNVREVDIAEVNGRCFVNNSSIGLYPTIVKHRDGQIERLGRGKWLAMLVATFYALRRFPGVHVRMTDGDRTWNGDVPFVMIGNNRYTFDLFNFAGRPRVDAGELGVYFANRTGRLALLKLVIRGWFRRLKQAQDFTMAAVPELWIESHKKELRVAVDGEICKLRTPLHYVIHSRALRVCAPHAT
jgi:diacylglycerol kinase family enzyme